MCVVFIFINYVMQVGAIRFIAPTQIFVVIPANVVEHFKIELFYPHKFVKYEDCQMKDKYEFQVREK